MADTDSIEAGIRIAERMTLRTLAKLALSGIVMMAVWSLWERRTEVTNALFSSVSAMIVLILIVVGLIAYIGLDGMIRDAEKRAAAKQAELQSQLVEYRARVDAQEQRIDALIEEQTRDGEQLRRTTDALNRLRRLVRGLLERGVIDRQHIPDSVFGDEA